MDNQETDALRKGQIAMNKEDEGRTVVPDAGQGEAQGETGVGQAACAETGTARVRRILIDPLSGLARPRRVAEPQHRDNLDRLARKLSYMDEGHLRGLVELVLGHSGKVALPAAARPACPPDGVILAWAYALQAPPIGQSDYPASVMRSAMGRRAHDAGYGVELLRMARRYGPPPGAYSLTQLRDEAEGNRRNRARLREAVEGGQRLNPDQDRWLKAYHDDALLVQQLIAEGDERRDAKGEAA